MALYVLSREALRDLAELRDFLTRQESSDRATLIVGRLHRAMTSLANYPGIGRKRPDLLGSPQCFPVQSWIIFYRPMADHMGIEIVRIIDGRRDIQTLLGRSP